MSNWATFVAAAVVVGVVGPVSSLIVSSNARGAIFVAGTVSSAALLVCAVVAWRREHHR